MKILIADSLHIEKQELESLNKVGYHTIEVFDKVSESDADVIVGSIETDEASLMKFPNLKLLHIPHAGYDRLNLQALKDRGIILVNGKGIFSKPIAEYILGKILVWAKKDHLYYKQQNCKEWIRISKDVIELGGKTIGILGTGSIGQETARLLQAFGCTVLGVNTNGRSIEYFDETYAMSEMEEVLKCSDVIVCTLPLNEQTYHLLGKKEFLAMKKEALFVNIGRGKEVNELELIEVLDTHLSMVVLDVFEKEPLPQESPLWFHPKVVITPHSSSESDLVERRRTKCIIENLVRFIEKEPLENRVV